jgi:hypothetical protein
LTKASKTYDEEKSASSTKMWIFETRSMSLWFKDLNIRLKTLKLVQERAGNILEFIGIGNNFLNRAPMAQQLRKKLTNRRVHEIKKVLYSKGNGHQT